MGVLVLGMHRSGTTATTQALCALGRGLELPSDDAFADPLENPRGYAESVRLTRFNDRLLTALGGFWSKPPGFDAGWVDRLQAEPAFTRHEAAGLFQQSFRTSNWVWKDPRNCLLVPYWSRILSDIDGVVVAFRDPWEVASSLEPRGIDPETGLDLWSTYVRETLRSLGTVPARRVLVLGYRTLITEPERWVRTATRFLRDLGIGVTRETISASRAVVDRELYRNRDLPGGPQTELGIRARELYDFLMSHEGSLGTGEVAALRDLPEWTAAVDQGT